MFYDTMEYACTSSTMGKIASRVKLSRGTSTARDFHVHSECCGLRLGIEFC